MGKLEAKWNQVKQAAQERTQVARERILGLKEQQLLDPKIPPSPPKPGYVLPDMSWKRDDIRAAEQVQQEREDPDRLLREQEAGIEWATRVIAEPYVNPEINKHTPDKPTVEKPLLPQIWESTKTFVQENIVDHIKYVVKPPGNTYAVLRNMNPPAWLSVSGGPDFKRDLFSSEYVGWLPGTGGFWKRFFYEQQTVSVSSSETGTRNPGKFIDVNISNGKATFYAGQYSLALKPAIAYIEISKKNNIPGIVPSISYTKDTLALDYNLLSSSWITAQSVVTIDQDKSTDDFQIKTTSTVEGKVRKLKATGLLIAIGCIVTIILVGEAIYLLLSSGGILVGA